MLEKRARFHNVSLVDDSKQYMTVSQEIAFTIYFVVGIWSTIFALQRLCKPGVSLEVRQLIIKRHISYIVCYLCCNIYLFIQEVQVRYITNP